MKPLTADEMRKALDEAEKMAGRIGRPVAIVHNRRWDQLWRGPWRVVEPGQADQRDVIVRDVMPPSERRPPTLSTADAAPCHTDVPLITAHRADLPGYQEPRS